ncbi:iron complex transport system permease protein [Virgibacillus campisalis]|uniref:Iron complex transport system permease protein n=2 Tax=Virgibacillus alimentarius TaxID=698769 RepID=A0ABS4SAU7_9BACI|nr:MULTISPECIES: iron ABC transporter permease [Virgibacillus]MBP2258629.1 iron complex transport system permease protein [Virgibacillus alimentarius]HLR66621.1 iron ABC transporter permease [Virgibacillus sp.]
MEVMENIVQKNRHPLAKKRTIVILTCGLFLVVASIMSLMIGQVSFSLQGIWDGIFSKEDSLARRIVWDLRFPRVLIGLIVGMCLASSGAILQGVMRNPLADPGIIGVSSGAGIAATVIMIIFPAYIALVPLAAFLGALITALLIYILSWKGGTSPVRIILVGVAINAVIGAAMSALMILYSDRVQSVLPWLAGGIAGVGWNQFEMIIYYAIAALLLAIYGIKHIRILRLGDEMAKLLGHNVERTRFFLIILSTLLAGIAVSVAGLIGFVGLVVPHILRIMIGGDHKYLLPASALGGGLLVVLADTIARSAFEPIEIPVGILLSFLGGPFFLYMIHRRRDSFASH